jgi:DNA-binding GntR family transcriptional regulator
MMYGLSALKAAPLVEAKTRALSIHDRIRTDILTGRIPPGQALQEEELAQQLGTSRTPVREALRLLQNDGLVAITPNRGAAVTEISLQQILEAYELRGLLEPYAGRAGAQWADLAEVERLEQVQRRVSSQPATIEDALSFDLADEELHEFVARTSRNGLLQQTVRKARVITRRALLVVAPERYEQSAKEHLAILAAYRRRDGERAARALRDHLRRAKERLLARGASRPGLEGREGGR